MAEKLFYKDKQGKKKPKHSSYGFTTKRTLKPGTAEHPLTLSVQTEERKAEVAALAKEQMLHAQITVDEAVEENIFELECIVNKPDAVTVEQTPQRNAPCSCGSGKKFKKCCG
jgi:SWIM/SEC-C metal-binding protein